MKMKKYFSYGHHWVMLAAKAEKLVKIRPKFAETWLLQGFFAR